jgi:hypothetical protein
MRRVDVGRRISIRRSNFDFRTHDHGCSDPDHGDTSAAGFSRGDAQSPE